MLAIVVVFLLAFTPEDAKALDRARELCSRTYDPSHVRACVERDRLRALLALEEDDRRKAKALAEAQAQVERDNRAAIEQSAAAQEPEDDQEQAKAEAALKKKCGKDYHRIQIGMSFTRVKKCSGLTEFTAKYQDTQATVYEANGGAIRVERGLVTRWAAP